MQIANAVLAILFVVFAYLQVNDPDPLLWIVVYLGVAVICGLRVFGIYRKGITLAVLILLIGFSGIYIPDVFTWLTSPDKGEVFGEMLEHKPHIEGTREFLGTWIAIAALLWNWRN